MSNLPVYIRKTVGGYLPINKLNVRPGHVISFSYGGERPRRIPRLIFILNTKDARRGYRLVHGINLENIRWTEFIQFFKKILVTDTLTLIKRKYEIRGPFNELLDKPKAFYSKIIKPGTVKYDDIYRTYKLPQIKNVKLWALNYEGMIQGGGAEKQLLINQDDSIGNIVHSSEILNELFDINTHKLKDTTYKQLVINRFGTVGRFYNSVAELNEMSDAELKDLL
jgi:hypothetical protein